MRDPKRLVPLYAYLAEIHEKNFPDMRIGQFLKNVSEWYGVDLFFIEDEKLYDLIPRFLESACVHNKYVNSAPVGKKKL